LPLPHHFPTRRSSDLAAPAQTSRSETPSRPSISTEAASRLLSAPQVSTSPPNTLRPTSATSTPRPELSRQVVRADIAGIPRLGRSEEHTSELQSPYDL